MTAEGGKSHITLARRTEPHTRRADHIGPIEKGFEELPRRHTIGCAHPDVWGILTTIAFIAKGAQAAEHPLGVIHVVVDGLLHLLPAFGCIDGFGGTL